MANICKRRWKNGRTTYRVLIRLKGHEPVTATFDRLRDAKEWAVRTEAELRAGRHGIVHRTLAEAIDRYVREVLPRKRTTTRATQRRQLTWWREQLGDIDLARLSPADIGRCRDKLSAATTARGRPYSPTTVRRYLAALSHVLSVAREWGWVPENPMARVSMPREPAGRARFLSDDERRRLLAACRGTTPALYPVVVLGLYTGMRLNEILGLCWRDVDFERRRVVLGDPTKVKNRERRQVPLPGPAYRVLEAWWGEQRSKSAELVRPRALLFPGRADPNRPIGLKRSWSTALRRAGIDDFRFHDLRHSTASYLAMAGATPGEIAEVLGHKSLQMVKRYAHLTEAHTASVMERMAEKFGLDSD